MADALDVFLSYSRADEVYLQELLEHLAPLERHGQIRVWHDREIEAGKEWRRQINERLESADVVIALVSPSYIASDSCWDLEKQRALDRHGHARVIPVVVRPCDWREARFAELQPLPKNSMAITTWDDRDEAWLDVVRGLRRVLRGMQAEGIVSIPTSPGRAIWHVPHRRNLSFTGRDGVLKELRSALMQEGRAAVGLAISGLGGIGKTQTAVEFAYRYRDKYDVVLWALAETEEELGRAFLEFAKVLELPEGEAQEQAVAVEAVRKWMGENDSWLMIFDNADRLALVMPFLPLAPRGHLLLTSRARSFGSLDIEEVRLKVLAPEDAQAFLFKRTGRNSPSARESEAARELAEELGYLPLALEQAAAFISDGSRIEDYLKSYQKRRLELLSKGQPRPDYPESVATTWTLNFEQVQIESPASAEILCWSAFLAPDCIPLEILVEGASRISSQPWDWLLRPLAWLTERTKHYLLCRRSAELGPVLFKALEAAGDDPSVLDDLLKPLVRLSLIERDPEERTFSVHRMVQEVVKNALEKNVQQLWAERCVRGLNRVFPSEEFQNWPWCERLSSHAKALLQIVDAYTLEFQDAALLFKKAGNYAKERGRYGEALPFYERSLHIWERVQGIEHPDVARSLNNFSKLHYDRGEYGQALQLLQRALQIREKALGKEHPGVATILNNLAELHRAQGDYDQALPLLQRSLQILEKGLGKEHPKVTTRFYNLALLYSAQGNHDQALLLLQRSLQILEKKLGEEHPKVAKCLNYLAELHRAQGESNQALQFFQRALQIQEKVLGEEHPAVATSLDNLGELHRDQGRYGRASSLFQRSLRIREKVFGDEHPDIAMSLTNLGELHCSQEEYDLALPLYQRALEIDETTLGENHPRLEVDRQNLVTLLREMEFTEAREAQIVEMEARVQTQLQAMGEMSEDLFPVKSPREREIFQWVLKELQRIVS